MLKRMAFWLVWAGASCTGAGGSDTPIPLPQVYPPVRANTPTALIADPAFAAPVSHSHQHQAMSGQISLAQAVQERLYSPGPTAILRILHEIDGRVIGLDPRPSQHPCLTAPPVSTTYALPGGQTFTVKLQCLERFNDGAGWIAFGFDSALAAPTTDAATAPPDGGALGADGGGNSFYLIEGQDRGLGGAYRIDRTTENVEGWIAVADKEVPENSQAIMHLLTNKAAGTLEMAFGGAGVGFCSAHLKTGAGFLFIAAKTNAPPPAGTATAPGTQYCDAVRTGCFAATALGTDLGGDAADCAAIGAGNFSIPVELDASMDPGANVSFPTIYTFFSHPPAGVAAF
jgi:hypothetical protein